MLLSEIKIASRFRKEPGNIEALAKSIQEVGLLHPIVINGDNELIAGWRRIKALKSLGRDEAPVRVVKSLSDAVLSLKAERDENTCREAFRITEAVALGRQLEKLLKPKAEEKKLSGKSADGKAGGRGKKKPSAKLAEGLRPRDEVAESVGIGRTTYAKAEKIIDAAKADPDLLSIVEEMDKTGNVSKAGKEVNKAKNKQKEQEAIAALPKTQTWQLTHLQDVIKCAAIVTDPPYGIIDEPWEPKELEPFTREWAQRWNKSEADTISVFWSQRHLWNGRQWLDEAFRDYEFQQLLIWHYPNNKSPQSRIGFKQTYEPIFFYRRKGSDRKILIGGSEWGDGINDFDCHVAAVPQSNFKDAEMKQHPAQKPVSVFSWIINAVTAVGELVCDPFCGSGTSGIAASKLNRTYHGIEINEDYRKIATGRIAAYGKL